MFRSEQQSDSPESYSMDTMQAIPRLDVDVVRSAIDSIRAESKIDRKRKHHHRRHSKHHSKRKRSDLSEGHADEAETYDTTTHSDELTSIDDEQCM